MTSLGRSYCIMVTHVAALAVFPQLHLTDACLKKKTYE